ncbi:MAG: hypothetical protein JWQ78_1715 [Sediminibacterium sp.]|nr:hypothetical protein [Sediminibacterium sp.]
MYKLLFFCLAALPATVALAQPRDPVPRPPVNNTPVVDPKEVVDNYAASNRSLIKDDEDWQFKQLPSRVNALGNLGLFTSHYLVTPFLLQTHFTDTIRLSTVNNIKLVDARFDNAKVGFLPVNNQIQKKGYSVLGLQVAKSPVEWLSQNFINKHIITDTSSHRQLVIVLEKLWYSSSASEHYTVTNPKLLTTLHYHFGIYTSLDIGYYPQKKLSGTITLPYNKASAYTLLADSLLQLLKQQVLTNQYSAKETEANWLSPVDFNDHYNNRFKRLTHPEQVPKGIYTSYQDFVDRKPSSDSVEMIVKYNNYDRALLYACQLTAFKDGQPVSCSRAWGYYDGVSLFVNTSSGFFIKLIRNKEDFVFFNLKNIREEKIKPDMQASILIGASSYRLLKDYTKAFALTYQLDYDTGSLY